MPVIEWEKEQFARRVSVLWVVNRAERCEELGSMFRATREVGSDHKSLNIFAEVVITVVRIGIVLYNIIVNSLVLSNKLYGIPVKALSQSFLVLSCGFLTFLL